jgi:hypothetical protein
MLLAARALVLEVLPGAVEQVDLADHLNSSRERLGALSAGGR